jgi:hypothetical protein
MFVGGVWRDTSNLRLTAVLLFLPIACPARPNLGSSLLTDNCVAALISDCRDLARFVESEISPITCTVHGLVSLLRLSYWPASGWPLNGCERFLFWAAIISEEHSSSSGLESSHAA